VMRILGIDPGLRSTGWGVIECDDGRLRHIANGAIQPIPSLADADRLGIIFNELGNVIAQYKPNHAAIEQIFVSKSVGSALRLGMARGAGLLTCGVNGLAVGEISARAVKKAVAGTGAAEKKQVQDMVTRLLSVTAKNADAADALAIAIAASNDAGKLANVRLGSNKGKAAGGLSAAIAAALARDDASNGGKT
jgi:crossover junction endodeoxyribonuclease RuvC